MRQCGCLSVAFLVLLAPATWADPPPKIARKIVEKPAFKQATQQYVLLLLGQKPHREIWIVRDGDDYYIDRNGNGDLTEPGEKITPPKAQSGTFNLVDFGKIVDAHDTSHGPLTMNLPATGSPSLGTVNLEVAKKFRQRVAIFPVATTPETAPVFHFDGPLTSGFLVSNKHYLVPAQDANALTLRRGREVLLPAWVGTQIKGSDAVHCVTFSLTNEKEEKRPRLEIVYDNRNPKGAPIVESYRLEEEILTTFSRRVRVPKDAGSKAKVKLTFPTLPDVPPYEIEVKVVD
jgi:hypothetical protein